MKSARSLRLMPVPKGLTQSPKKWQRSHFLSGHWEERNRSVSRLLLFLLPEGLLSFSKKDLAGEEVLVLNHIQAAGNEGCLGNFPLKSQVLMLLPGIWTKHLKAKTELHQTVIDRCIKSLIQKQLIKSVKNVKVNLCTRPLYPSTQKLSSFLQENYTCLRISNLLLLLLVDHGTRIMNSIQNSSSCWWVHV